MNKQQLLNDNMKLVHLVINKYYPSFTHDEEIIQMGRIGLWKASKTWDENKCKFSTYATNCIRNEICREFRRRCRLIDTISLETNITFPNGEKGTLKDMIRK